MGLFRKKPQGQTVLLLDVENGSVGVGLLRLERDAKPKLFGQWRKHIPLFHTHDAGVLLKELEEAAVQALIHASEVATRIRHHSAVPHMGDIARAAVVLHPPWATLEINEKGPGSSAPEDILALFRKAVHDTHGNLHTSFHPFGAAAIQGVGMLTGGEGALVCNITGEVCEIVALSNGQLAGSATIPFGERSLLRTLKTHGNLTESEARSGLALGHLREPLSAAAEHFGKAFSSAARELLMHDTRSVFVVGSDHASSWAAQALSNHQGVASLFPYGGVVRTVRPPHFASQLSAAAEHPDLFLTINAVFIDSKLSS